MAAPKNYTKPVNIQAVNYNPPPRINSRQIPKSAIQPHNLRQTVVIVSPTAGAIASPVPNGNQVLFAATVTIPNDAFSKPFLAMPEVSIYVNSVATNNQLPGGSAVDESNYQMIGPWIDWGASDGKKVVVKCYVRNISAGSVDLLVRLDVRFISDTSGSGTGIV